MALDQRYLDWLLVDEHYKSLADMARGIERECLRVTPEGKVAQTPHPKAFGSSLCHDSITTDYSEALLEMITKPHSSIEECLEELTQLHQYVHQRLEDEYLWPYSMPPQLIGDSEIPIAEYGESLVGRMKKVYRKGLGLRYGRKMQSIAGVHYNVSFPEAFWQDFAASFYPKQNVQSAKNAGYFALVRSFLRDGWILTLLTGSSPLCHQSFVEPAIAQSKGLQLVKGAYIAQDSSSLRMGGVGYHNSAQSDLFVCYDSIDHYIYTLSQALQIPSPVYSKFGLYNELGRRHQLSENLLQIENEFYGSIRPKQVARSMERPTLALQERGVAYVEIRNIDVDPQSPSGITPTTAAMIEIFVTGCLLSQSAFLTKEENNIISVRNERVAMAGRADEYHYVQQALEHWQTLAPVAQALANANQDSLYLEAYETAIKKLEDPRLLQSALQVAAFKELSETTSTADLYTQQAMNLARQHQVILNESPLDRSKIDELNTAAAVSLQEFEALPLACEHQLTAEIEKYLENMPPHPQEECTALA